VKFSVKSIYPTSIYLFAANWESAPTGLKYFCGGDGNENQRHGTDSNYDLRYVSILELNQKPQDTGSGGYRKTKTVPT
jgi:hypothetical protein